MTMEQGRRLKALEARMDAVIAELAALRTLVVQLLNREAVGD